MNLDKLNIPEKNKDISKIHESTASSYILDMVVEDKKEIK